jgi:hypothetical protein
MRSWTSLGKLCSVFAAPRFARVACVGHYLVILRREVLLGPVRVYGAGLEMTIKDHYYESWTSLCELY